jgi:hypothetical protein
MGVSGVRQLGSQSQGASTITTVGVTHRSSHAITVPGIGASPAFRETAAG